MKNVLALLVLLLSIFTSSCSSQNRELSSEQIKTLLAKEKSVIIDVRTSEEFKDGHLKSSINLPLDQLADSVKSLHKYEHIILVCRSGNRSGKAKSLLEEKFGFKHLYNGGGWKELKEIIQEDDK